MSVSFSCDCPERRKPISGRAWVVLQRNCHHSAFAGYKKTWSEYSTVLCKSCGRSGRTKAKYVDSLEDAK